MLVAALLVPGATLATDRPAAAGPDHAGTTTTAGRPQPQAASQAARQSISSIVHPARNAASRPDFGPGDKLSAAWARGDVTVDQYVRWSVERLTRPENLPATLRGAGPLDESTGLSLGYALSLTKQTSPATQAWLKRTLRAVPSAGTASTTWTECANDYVFLGVMYFDCRHTIATSPPIYVHYNIDGVSQHFLPNPGSPGSGTWLPLDGLPAVDVNGNGIPDAADLMIDSFTVAFQRYQAWGFQTTGPNISVYVGVDVNNNPGLTFATGDVINGGPVILLPSDPGQNNPDRYTYLPRHELFHAFQYHYMSVAHFGAEATSINWWMEATAEWATHQVYLQTGAAAPGWQLYASAAATFLSQPTDALNAHDGFGGFRQYGAFLLAQYLTEQTDFQFVRRTWEAMDNSLPVLAIDKVLGDYHRSLSNDLVGFALANYRLTGASPNLSQFLGTADGYADADTGLWRSELGSDGRPAIADTRLLSQGDSVGSSVSIQPGGVAYLDYAPISSGRSQLTVHVGAPARTSDGNLVQMQYALFSWDNLTSRTPQMWSRESTGGDIAQQRDLTITLNAGQTATLVMIRTDLSAESNPPPTSTASIQWTASMSTGTAAATGPNTALNNMWAQYANRTGYSTMCADWSGGDGTQSVLLPTGQRAWFFSDTYLGDGALRPTYNKSILRNSIVVQGGSPAGATLRTITGGNTCREQDTSLPLEDRYAYSPVRTNVTGPDIGGQYYWSASGKVLGNNVVWFYLKGESLRFLGSSMATIPVDQLENGSSVNVVPNDLPARSYYGNDNPIIWGSEVVDDPDGYTYIYGWAVVDANNNKKPFLARVPRASLTDFSSWRFYTGSGNWSSDGGASGQAKAVPLNTRFTDPMYSVVTLNGRHWLVTLDPSTHNVVAYPSLTRWGFSTARVTLYTPPEAIQQAPDYRIMYDLHLHAGLATSNNSVVISYNVNTTAVNLGCRTKNDYVPSIYRARFVNLATAAFDPSAATTSAVSLAAPGPRPASDARAGRGISSPPVPAGDSPRPTGVARATTIRATASYDNAYYNSWSYQSDADQKNNHTGCPYLPAPTNLTSTVVNSWGWVELNWDALGPDVGYQIYEYNVTKNERRKWPWDWTFGPPRTIGALDDYPDDRGNVYEWYLVPINIWQQPETTKSNKTQSMLPL